MTSTPSRAPQSPEETDELLALDAQQAPEGDLRAFEKLVRRHLGKVVANCRYITRDNNNAEDLAQEVLVKVYFGLRSFEGRSSFGHWLRQVKANHCINHLKKTSGRSFVSVDDSEACPTEELKTGATAEQLAEQISERALIGQLLEDMPTSLRIPLLLCDMDGLSYEEIAQALEIGLSATKMRIKRARDDFRARYKQAQPLEVHGRGTR